MLIHMQITADVFEAYLKCPTKCFLRAHNEAGTGNVYANWVRTETEAYRNASIKQLTEGASPDECVTGLARTKDLKTAKWRLAAEMVTQARNLESRIHAIERIPSGGRGRAAEFIPVRFIFRNKLSKDDKLLLAFDALVLSEMLERPVSAGKIIHGDNYSTLKVKTASLRNRVSNLAEKIDAMFSTDKAPDLVLNRYCGECEFQTRCRQKAVEKDDLSLLSGMSEKERKRFNSKGIFTVTQLSYTFRPRRRPKRLRDKREKYHHALKAMAIREKKIHIVGSPELKIEGTPVYLDVEGLPDRDFYYLIGVRVGNGESAVQHSLWADTIEDEGKIWREFLGILETVETPVLIHYGSYETDFVKRMCARYGAPPEGAAAATSITSAVNLLSEMYARVYFPTHSNSLKEVARFLGFTWSAVDASGRQAIMWRHAWEATREPTLKQALTQYNCEDCLGLARVAETLAALGSPARGPEGGDNDRNFVAVDSQPRQTMWPRFSSPIAAFEQINQAARWDYQRERVYVRTSLRIRRPTARKRIPRKLHRNLKILVIPEQSECPTCQQPGVRRPELKTKGPPRPPVW